MKRSARHRVLPGFGLSLGYATAYLGLVVIIPVAALFWAAAAVPAADLWAAATEPRVLAAYRLTFGAAALAALVNAVFGFVVAWTLVRQPFPGSRLLDALVDLPFALPTAVSGIALASMYGPRGWLGAPLAELGIQVAYAPLGIGLAMTLIGLPFVVRTLQPAIEDLPRDLEEAAASLGATRRQVFLRVLFPALLPALFTGTTLAFARALGEYGSIVFIAGNLPYHTEIASLLVIAKLEQYDYAGATAIALTLLVASFLLLLLINVLQAWALRSRERA